MTKAFFPRKKINGDSQCLFSCFCTLYVFQRLSLKRVVLQGGVRAKLYSFQQQGIVSIRFKIKVSVLSIWSNLAV